MVARFKQAKIFKYLLQTQFFHRACAASISMLLLSESVAVMASNIKITQQPPAATQSQAYTEGRQLLEQGQTLFKQGTNQSRQQAIAKYTQALQIWRKIGDRSSEALTLQSIGLVYYTLSDNRKALDNYTQALNIRRALGDRYGEAIILSSIAGVYANLGERQKAIQSYTSAVALFQAEKKTKAAALTLTSLGGVYINVGDTQKALAAYSQALEILRASGDKVEVGNTLSILGSIYTFLGETQQALQYYNQALQIQRSVGNQAGVVDSLRGIGTLYVSIGENQKALDSFNQAVKIQRSIGANPSEQASTLIGIASSNTLLSNYPQAIATYNQAIALLQQAGNRLAQAEALNQISFVYDYMGEKQKALAALNQALEIQRASGDLGRQAFTLANIAGIYDSLGEKQQALDVYNSAIALQRQVKDRSGEAGTLNDIAKVYSSLGDYQQSINAHNSALTLFRAIGNRQSEGQTLDNIAGVYRLLGDYRQALTYYNQALASWRQQGDRFREVATLTGVVRAYESLKDYPQALSAANTALKVARSQKSSLGEASALALMGRVYLASGDYTRALDVSNRALAIFEQLGIRAATAPTLDNIGKVYNGLKNPQQAIATYNRALSLWRSLGDRSSEAESLYNIASTERDRGNLGQAQTQIEAAIKVVEALRIKIASKELRATYFASVQKYYEFYIDLLMQRHKQEPGKGFDALALQASDRARARSLLEILTESNADIRQGVNPQLLDKERNLGARLDAAETKRVQLLNNNQTTQAKVLEQQVTELLQQYQDVQAQIRTISPRYAALTQPQALTLAQIQKLLDPDTVMLQYFLGEKRSYLWTVTPNSITSYELPPQLEIETVAKQFYKLVTDKRFGLTRQDLAKTSATLSDILLKPVAEKIGKKRLVIVSDGALQYIPFAALTVPGNNTPLLVEHEIVNLPSISTIGVLRRELKGRKSAPKTVAVIADPVFTKNDERVKIKGNNLASNKNIEQQSLQRSAAQSGVTFARLPGTRQEAEQILALVPATERSQTFDFAASRATVTNPNLSQYRILHFATHGILNSVNPELSGVVLSLVDEKGAPQNGFLRLNEIFNLNLPAELVVLSACQTGLGSQIRGEGIVSLTRGFMYAGAPRVVVSLWNVDDRATADLMGKFYTGMLKKGLKPAAALREAQIAVWKQDKWKSPYYWAAFGLQGEWK